MSRDMTRIVEKAIAKSLTHVAAESMKDLKIQAQTDLHLTRPFIKKSIQYDAANVSNMKSEVGIVRDVYFADLLVKGGERSPRSKYVAVPVKAKGANGRAKKSMSPEKILNKRGYFLRTIHGVKGIWYCTTRMLYPKLMYVLVLRTEYDKAPYLDWERTVINAVARSDFEGKFMENIQRALNQS
jgi:hypothetical protein